ncbi:hypothetical protein [Haloferula sp. A504]|uniref:hypothetical protein n=1 Tax=Haloferula sp. A504 TaxID=3373601 RepID=UPI0031C0A211|nr:protein-export chaperone SecB [Verrucomicrobiaceae bacterium E54]
MNSPLQLERSRLVAITVKETGREETSKPDVVTATTTLLTREDDPRAWRVQLKVKFGGNEKEPTASVCGEVEIEGDFRVRNEYPEEAIPRLVGVNGASILFGSVRELIAGLSGRMESGVYLLPSVSFYEPKKKAAKSTTPRKNPSR